MLLGNYTKTRQRCYSLDSAGQLTARLIRHVEALSLRFFEIEFATYGDAEVVARPTSERNVHDTHHEVQAPQRPVFLPCRARAIAVAVESFNRAPGFFLGRIVEADPNDLAHRDKLDCEADHGAPEVPSLVIERAPEEDIELCKVLDRGGSSEPQIGRDGVTVGGQGPTTGQQYEGAPRGSSKEVVKEGHDDGSKGRVHKSVHGNVLQQESLS